MASNTLLGAWATGIWTDLGSPSTLSALTISGYAVQPSTLGRLNSLIGACYSGTGYLGTGAVFDAAPDLTNRELAIIEGMVRTNWYNQLAQTMMGLVPADIPWTSLAEGDSKIARGNAINIGKEYREMAKQAQEFMLYLANAYSIDESGPRDCEYLSPPPVGYPGPLGGYNWRY